MTLQVASVLLVNPRNGRPLARIGDRLVDGEGGEFPILGGIPRIADPANYAESFGIQWNRFARTQLDDAAAVLDLSRLRFFAETHWDREDLSGRAVLEVGSGAGRFTRVFLEHTKGTLYSVDLSDAVSANLRNNGHIAPGRLHLFQASIYELPFPDNAFDKVFCFGVLQHTPDFEASIKALIDKAKPSGEVAVDFYPIRGWWTKVSAKYMLRPFARRLSHPRLLELIERHIDWLMSAQDLLSRTGLGVLNRFLPIANVNGPFFSLIDAGQRRELAVLDTFDMFSPAYDNPQRVADVARMFEHHGASVTFAGYEEVAYGMRVAVVRGLKRGHDRVDRLPPMASRAPPDR